MTGLKADLVIIGAGPAGMAAACEARDLGLSVVLLDEQQAVGGQIYRAVETAPDARVDVLGPDYAAGRALAEQFRRSGTLYRTGATVWKVSDNGEVDFTANGSAETAIGSHIIFATGAMERPFPVEGWTLPGVMGAGAAQILLKGSGALPSEPAVLVGCGPLLYLLAWQYLRVGVAIRAIVDTTAPRDYLRAARFGLHALLGHRDLWKGLKLLRTIRQHNVKVFSGASALTIEGESEVVAISFKRKRHSVRLPASLVLLHQGVVPNTQLSWSVGAEHHWNVDQLCWQPTTDKWGRLGDRPIYIAGDSRAIVGAQASAVQGRLAALAVADRLGRFSDLDQRAEPHWRAFRRLSRIRPFLDSLYRPKDENRIPRSPEVLVCRCEEVTAGQLRDFVRLGVKGPNQAKAFGRCGMGPCQGRLCGLTVTELIARERGIEAKAVGYYRIRPPIKPIMLGDFLEPDVNS